MANLNTIKDWFRTGLKPTQAQFWATWDSFWNKEELIPVGSIESLQDLLDEKADAEALSGHLNDENAHLSIIEEIRSEIAGKSDIGHTHPQSEITGLPETIVNIENDITELFNSLGVVADTYANISDKIASNELVVGGRYKITDADPDLYGGTEILLTAVAINAFSAQGVGKFFNAKYDKSLPGYGIFGTMAPERDALVIWGGTVWTGSGVWDGSGGSSVDDLNLNGQYGKVEISELYYDITYDEIKFDFANNMIVYRSEGINFVETSKTDVEYFEGKNPIRYFQWGNRQTENEGKGIGNNKIVNSLYNNINFIGQYLADISLSKSLQDLTTWHIRCYQQAIRLVNSDQTGITFIDTSEEQTGEPNQFELDLTSSSQENIMLDNSSQQYLKLYVSYQLLVSLKNCSQENLVFEHGSQENLDFDGIHQGFLKFIGCARDGSLPGQGVTVVSHEDFERPFEYKGDGQGGFHPESYKCILDDTDEIHGLQVTQCLNNSRRTVTWSTEEPGVYAAVIDPPFNTDNVIVTPRSFNMAGKNSDAFASIYSIHQSDNTTFYVKVSAAGDLSINTAGILEKAPFEFDFFFKEE